MLSVERREDIAEVIVRGRPIPELAEPAQKIELLLAEQCDIDEGLGPGQHRQQAQKQDLVQRISDLAALPRIGDP